MDAIFRQFFARLALGRLGRSAPASASEAHARSLADRSATPIGCSCASRLLRLITPFRVSGSWCLSGSLLFSCLDISLWSSMASVLSSPLPLPLPPALLLPPPPCRPTATNNPIFWRRQCHRDAARELSSRARRGPRQRAGHDGIQGLGLNRRRVALRGSRLTVFSVYVTLLSVETWR